MTPSRTPSGDARRAKLQVRNYLAALPPGARRHLRKLREVIVSAAPGAIDSFSYGIPAFRLDGKPLVWYAAWREHISLYPMTASVRRSLATRLKGYETSKGTVRLPLAKPVPVTLVRQLVKARIVDLQRKGSDR